MAYDISLLHSSSELVFDNPPARAPWLQYVVSINLPAQFYGSQVVWVDQIRVDASGQIWRKAVSLPLSGGSAPAG